VKSAAAEWLETAIVLLCIAMAFIVLSACSTVTKPVSPATFYRRDMGISVDGREYPGYGVLPLKDSYDIRVTTKHDMDRFTATSCHRQIIEEKVDGAGWFSKKATYKFTFSRSSGIEKSDPCPLQLTASSDGNEHSWGFLDFETSSERLPANLECDGWQRTAKGVSVCQAKANLVQKIAFDQPAFTSFDQNCSMPIPADKKTFIYSMPRGRCVFVFCSRDKECHRLTTIGYDEAWLRGQKE
jgi:hypothetical protein